MLGLICKLALARGWACLVVCLRQQQAWLLLGASSMATASLARTCLWSWVAGVLSVFHPAWLALALESKPGEDEIVYACGRQRGDGILPPPAIEHQSHVETCDDQIIELKDSGQLQRAAAGDYSSRRQLFQSSAKCDGQLRSQHGDHAKAQKFSADFFFR